MKDAIQLITLIFICLLFNSCSDSEIQMEPTPYISVQERLNNGDTPQSLHEVDRTPIDSLIGKEYLGGIIAFINRKDNGDLKTSEFEKFGIIAAKELLGPTTWGCKGEKMDDIYDTIFNGSINTNNVAENCDEPNIAAKLALEYEVDGYKDWHLPSLAACQEIGYKLGKSMEYPMVYVWSSSEYYNPHNTWALKYIGQQNLESKLKSEELYVLPIKHF